MKRYTDPEVEVVSFEIADATNFESKGDNEGSVTEGFFGNIQINW